LLTDTDDSCAFLGRVVKNALTYFIIQVRAVVICLDCVALGVVGVCMKGVEVGAYPLDWSEVLIKSVGLLYERIDTLA
jgi:hypothetical protein